MRKSGVGRMSGVVAIVFWLFLLSHRDLPQIKHINCTLFLFLFGLSRCSLASGHDSPKAGRELQKDYTSKRIIQIPKQPSLLRIFLISPDA